MELYLQPLPHGISLSCRATGRRGQPVLMFLHGFPEGAFAWDGMLQHFARPENGGYRCIAPNLRGFEQSSAPIEAHAYRVEYLLQDITELIAVEGGTLQCLVAHDWGGALAWTLASKLPHLLDKLAIINSPHPASFLRELQDNPKQQAASAYMNFLIRPDAESLLSQEDYRRLWEFFSTAGASQGSDPWLTEGLKAQYRGVWDHGLTGGCNYYRAARLCPAEPLGTVARQGDPLSVNLPTLVIWGMNDLALRPELLDGLGDCVPRLTLKTVADASHWIVHEQPERVIRLLGDFLLQ